MDLTEKTQHGNRHPWEISRAHCIQNIIKKYLLNSVADIGAGDRFFTLKLRSFIPGPVYAIDTGYSAKTESVNDILCLNDIAALPELNDKPGLVLMDVLEHIEHDTIFMKDALEKIPSGSIIFITVLAFQFLFSEHDKFMKHYRRYSRKQLLALISSQNLQWDKCHYFYFSLFLARLIQRFMRKVGNGTDVGSWRFSENNLLTKTIYGILNMDFYICQFLATMRIYLPGLSLLAVCRKQ